MSSPIPGKLSIVTGFATVAGGGAVDAANVGAGAAAGAGFEAVAGGATLGTFEVGVAVEADRDFPGGAGLAKPLDDGAIYFVDATVDVDGGDVPHGFKISEGTEAAMPTFLFESCCSSWVAHGSAISKTAGFVGITGF